MAPIKELKAVSTGYCPGCFDCEEDAQGEGEEKFIEPWFSGSACEWCGDTLAGMREPAHGLDSENNIVHFVVCEDCVISIDQS